MIPKIIHYCWFGGAPLSELAQQCIASWKKYCPDYEIKCWDETNFDINCCEYVRKAYEEKMWAFVSDYARFKILFEHGGVYFDTDVELIKPIDDIIEKGSFMGMEQSSQVNVAPGLGLAFNSGFSLVEEILNDYHNSCFVKNREGVYKTVVTRVTDILLKYGNIYLDKISNVAGITIYPPEYFCPLNYYTGEMNITKNSRSIHHYMASWVTPEERKIFKIKEKISNKGGLIEFKGNIEIFALKVKMKIKVLGMRGCIEYIWNKVKLKMSCK